MGDADGGPQLARWGHHAGFASPPSEPHMKTSRILVVDDDDSLRRVLQVQLEQDGYSVVTAASAQQAFSLLQLRAYDLVITDLRMPGLSGIEVLKQVKSQYPETVVIVLTAFGTVETAVEAMKAGAYDFLTKPVHPEELSLVVARALDHLRLIEEVRALARQSQSEVWV